MNANMSQSDKLRERLKEDSILPMIGVYDVFSAGLVADYFEGLFCSGYGFSASYYGLPDNGHMTWSDVVAYVLRIRAVLPENYMLVDIDDGFGDENIAVDVVRRLEIAGASAVMMEDQRRPKKCGHLDGKDIIPLQDYIKKLKRIIDCRQSMFVLARTDAVDLNEGIERMKAFVDLGVDAVMVEGLADRKAIDRVCAAAGNTPVAVNLIKGGKTPLVSLTELQDHGAKIAIYSTPCLFTAQKSITKMLRELSQEDGLLSKVTGQASLAENDKALKNNTRNSIYANKITLNS